MRRSLRDQWHVEVPISQRVWSSEATPTHFGTDEKAPHLLGIANRTSIMHLYRNRESLWSFRPRPELMVSVVVRFPQGKFLDETVDPFSDVHLGALNDAHSGSIEDLQRAVDLKPASDFSFHPGQQNTQGSLGGLRQLLSHSLDRLVNEGPTLSFDLGLPQPITCLVTRVVVLVGITQV